MQPGENPYASPSDIGYVADYKQHPTTSAFAPIVVKGTVVETDAMIDVWRVRRDRLTRMAKVAFAVICVLALLNLQTLAAQPIVDTLICSGIALFAVGTLALLILLVPVADAPRQIASSERRWFRATISSNAFELRRVNSICIFRWDALAVSRNDLGLLVQEMREESTVVLQFIPRRLFLPEDWRQIEAMFAKA
jgi:hypothetical protein